MSVLERERTGGVLTLTLNRPESLNAFTRELLRDLTGALAEAAEDAETRVVVITGAGRGFCAGQDLKELDTDHPEFHAVLDGYNPMIRSIAEMGKPVIAGVNGAAAGAGMSLALACDFRLASTNAVFVTTFSRIGLTADSGMSYFLPRLIGMAKAYELLVLSPRLSADEALGLGLVNRVIPDEKFASELRAFAAQLAQGPTFAYGLIKHSLRRGMGPNLPDVLAFEADRQEEAGQSHDFQEGVAAFREKRAPAFTGR